ncbi:tabkunin 2-like [Argiope bruennichi]|uniref:BPTI/Kunitz domain-containing protein like n=1 Tax=Argiope bruennichi TaxID=94029 RepID=A0A8T0ESU5_ARGBR|nr:tabkunin 2-like [Argiope bruennichi]KAF8778950.1 BPTI/Kunitz domain-containing protein like [Argiope bruennichi]
MISILLLLLFSYPATFICSEDEESSDPNFDPEACNLKSDYGNGTCSTAVPRWHYDNSTQTCHPFVYSGSGGNGNNFKTFDMCYIRCFLVPNKTRDGKE